MAKQLTHSQQLISIGGIALAGLGSSEVACQLSHLCCAVVRMALEALPAMILMAWQTSQVLAFDHPRLVECLCQFACLVPLVVSLVKIV